MQSDKPRPSERQRANRASLQDVEILTVAALEIAARADAPPEVLDSLLDAVRELQYLNPARDRVS